MLLTRTDVYLHAHQFFLPTYMAGLWGNGCLLVSNEGWRESVELTLPRLRSKPRSCLSSSALFFFSDLVSFVRVGGIESWNWKTTWVENSKTA